MIWDYSQLLQASFKKTKKIIIKNIWSILNKSTKTHSIDLVFHAMDSQRKNEKKINVSTGRRIVRFKPCIKCE